MTILDIEVPIEARTRLETTDDREEDMRIINLNRSKSNECDKNQVVTSRVNPHGH